MRPRRPLPIAEDFSSTEAYVRELLDFATTSDTFQVLCGGVHILDFFTTDPGLFHVAVSQEWQDFLLASEPMALLDLLMRDDLDTLASKSSASEEQASPSPPESLLAYIRAIRRLSLGRSYSCDNESSSLSEPPRRIIFGMKPKKLHEVTHFARYVDQLACHVARKSGRPVTHLVDFGSGQNYLGRVLAAPPYNRHVIGVEGREANIIAAKDLDMLAGLAEKEKVMRNKKVYDRVVARLPPGQHKDEQALKRAAQDLGFTASEIAAIDLRRRRDLAATYAPRQEGQGSIHYVSGRLESADLAEILAQTTTTAPDVTSEGGPSMMAISIHSCGNLSHYAIRSLVQNASMQAVAIVGCCYNLLTEKLGPPTYKLPYMRPSLQAINGRVRRESEKHDPDGFPLSERVSTYKGDGVRLNITARMMACQAPQNWTDQESDSFFTRHFYRAVLQKIFLDKSVILRDYHNHHPKNGSDQDDGESDQVSPFDLGTSPVIIGSLRKQCYTSFRAYVRGAISKLTTHSDYTQYSNIIRHQMADMTDDEIDAYEARYRHRKRELSAIWSLMAFSACVIESLIITDRWLYLREQADLVTDAWVETVFNYRQSPRNLVVVGIKRADG